MKTGATNLITPRLQVLSPDQKETLFLSVLDVLERVGVRVDNDEGVELLDGAGARIFRQNQDGDVGSRVSIPSHLVEDALASAPRR